MGSVLFTGVGHALGGPLGAAVAGAVGGVLDGALGPRRLSASVELGIQSSAYGEVIPRLFGRTRVAGQLIWATPLTARETKNNGARAYTASLAVALSARPIREIGRIWADGREIRNAEGQMEQPVIMRTYTGEAGQKPDPLIVAAEEVGRAPAYEGIAYIVFEELALASFGNRIPNLTFEVIADDAGPDEWLGEMAARAEIAVGQGHDIPGIIGHVARRSLSTELQSIARLVGVRECLADGQIAFDRDKPAVHLQGQHLIFSGNSGQTEGRWEDNRPSGIQVGYSDPDRDFQGSRQSIIRQRTGRLLDIDTAASMDAGAARHLCAQWLRDVEHSARRLKVSLPWRFAFLAVGDIVTVDADSTRWRVVERSIQGMLIHIEAEAVAGVGREIRLEGDGGRSLASAVVPAPPTLLEIFELPMVPYGQEGAAWAWASGGPGWRGAQISFDDGSGERDLGWISASAPFGRLIEPMSAGPETYWDEKSYLAIRIGDPEVSFESRNAEAVLAGANLLKVGDELVQFRSAELLKGEQLILRGLLRGRLGTGHAICAHPAGTQVQMLRPQNLISLPVSIDSVGRKIRCIARGAGDPPAGTTAERTIDGTGFAPLAPIHVEANILPDGSLHVAWKSRNRSGIGRVGEGSDVEIFEVEIEAEHGGAVRVPARGDLPLIYTSDDQIRDFGIPVKKGTVTVTTAGAGPLAIRAAQAAAF